ncbi:hypothetical protein ACSZML_20985 [Aeromonas rivipollensis]
MLRLLALLLICLVSPLRALTLTPLVEGSTIPGGWPCCRKVAI